MKATATSMADARVAQPNPGPREHALFKRFPLAGQFATSRGMVPTPYHIYDGHGVFIGGSADAAVARAALAGERVQPVPTDDGRVLMGLWVFDFTDASLGAHHELQCSLFVSRAATPPPVQAHDYSVIEAMVTRPDVHMLCHLLWNDSERVVGYNRELLGLDARLSASRIERADGRLDFAVRDVASDRPIVSGSLRETSRASLRASWALLRSLGLRRLAAVARQPWIRTPIMNPVGEVVPDNALADSFTRADRSLLRSFDPRSDRLEFADARLRALDFAPRFVQRMTGFKFVYLFPR